MKILLLGGTGAIGSHLANSLLESGHEVYITTRSKKENKDKLYHIVGNAKESSFIKKISEKSFDCVVDFMVYSTQEFESNHDGLLRLGDHYVYLSSCRVFADTKEPIHENTPRLLDVVKDQEYLQTDEYALSKARQENILRKSPRNNWTIVRPYITYGENRLQLTVMEKEDWLQRAIKGRKIIFCSAIGQRITTLTHGCDVANFIQAVILEKNNVFADCFNLTSQCAVTWNEVLDMYALYFHEFYKKDIKIKYIELKHFANFHNNYQIFYDRLYNRIFDNQKCEELISGYKFKDCKMGLHECMRAFSGNPIFDYINPKHEALKDRYTGDYTSLREFCTLDQKLKYIYNRI